jgi:hypothetical protein
LGSLRKLHRNLRTQDSWPGRLNHHQVSLPGKAGPIKGLLAAIVCGTTGGLNLDLTKIVNASKHYSIIRFPT